MNIGARAWYPNLETAMLTSEQFDRTRRLALRLAGLDLHERHRELLDQRIRRLGIHDGASLDALLNAADDGDQALGLPHA